MAGKKAKRTTPTVCIVESLDFLQEDSLKEGEIISRTLRLSEKPAHYTYLRSSDEMKAFVKEFGRSQHRYLHVSCHGNASAFLTTTGQMSAVDFAEMLAPHVDNRRVFLSACQAAQSEFATCTGRRYIFR
jgi:CHAT domain-containing protein